MDDVLTPPFDTKLAVVVRDTLEPWQRLNVTAFLTSGLASASPWLIGQPYQDADGQEYLALLGMPAVVFEASLEVLAQARSRALRRQIPLAIYTADMFRTAHNAANRGTVAGVAGEALDLVGLALHGPKNAVDKVIKGSRLHP